MASDAFDLTSASTVRNPIYAMPSRSRPDSCPMQRTYFEPTIADALGGEDFALALGAASTRIALARLPAEQKQNFRVAREQKHKHTKTDSGRSKADGGQHHIFNFAQKIGLNI